MKALTLTALLTSVSILGFMFAAQAETDRTTQDDCLGVLHGSWSAGNDGYGICTFELNKPITTTP